MSSESPLPTPIRAGTPEWWAEIRACIITLGWVIAWSKAMHWAMDGDHLNTAVAMMWGGSFVAGWWVRYLIQWDEKQKSGRR